MKESEDILTYSQSDHGHVYSCRYCGMIHLVFKSIAITLYRFEFDALLECLEQIEDHHFDYPHPCGMAATLTFSKLEDGFFCLTKEDHPEMQALLVEAALMIKVHGLIQP